MSVFKMKDVEYRRRSVWNPDCMTKSPKWVAFLNGEEMDVPHADTKTELLYYVRLYRHSLMRKG